jgi:hypothetical protein
MPHPEGSPTKSASREAVTLGASACSLPLPVLSFTTTTFAFGKINRKNSWCSTHAARCHNSKTSALSAPWRHKSANRGACHTFGVRASNKQRKKIRVRSKRWLWRVEFVGHKPRDELKESISLVEGTFFARTLLGTERVRRLRAGL